MWRNSQTGKMDLKKKTIIYAVLIQNLSDKSFSALVFSKYFFVVNTCMLTVLQKVDETIM